LPTADPRNQRDQPRSVAFWVTLARGLFAVFLGLALILNPDKTRTMLVNFMGMFWLASGIMSLRWGVRGERVQRWPLLAGAIGILAGLIALTRNVTREVLGEVLVIIMLAGVMILTGLIHAVGGFRTGADAVRQWSWSSFLLGVFEVVLGILLLVTPSEHGSLIYWAASIWAFIGAFILLAEALRIRAKRRRQKGNVKTGSVTGLDGS
jgi:uncharacterized membrane protein HdeD (DUF308 family)